MGNESLETDVRWIKDKLGSFDNKLENFDTKLDVLVTKETCSQLHREFEKDSLEIKEMIDRRLKDKAPANEFNIVKLLVFGYTGLILMYAVRSWLQTLFVSTAGAGIGL